MTSLTGRHVGGLGLGALAFWRGWRESKVVQALSGVAAFAAAINADRSTVYRHLSGDTEAGPRLVGAVLTAFPVLFNDAFDVTEVTVSGRRTYRGRRAA